MFDSLHGRLLRRTPTDVVVECGGVGYRVQISLVTAETLSQRAAAAGGRGGTATQPAEESLVRLFVQPHYTETEHRLFGFATEAERSVFRLLQGVRGVGPTLALAILSHEPVESLLAILRAEDVARLTRIKGVGKKTAERLLVELRDRLDTLNLGDSVLGTATPPQEDQLLAQVVQGLAALGMTPAEAAAAARKAREEQPDETRVERLLREALRHGRGRA